MVQNMQEKITDAQEEINKKTGRNMPMAIATGALLVALVLVCLFFLPPVAFFVVVTALLCGAIWELHVSFSVAGIHVPTVTLIIVAVGMMAATFFSRSHVASLVIAALVGVALAVCVALLNPLNAQLGGSSIAAARAQAQSSASKTAHEPVVRSRLRDAAAAAFIVLYVSFCASFVILMLTQQQYRVRVMMALFLPALSDTGGLAFGAAFGKHELSPRISPKKSYEGLAGSALFAVVGALLFYGLTFRADFLAFGWWKPVLLGLVVALVGTLGDLSASMLKRDLGIKDFGHLLKGHGGVMDRADSILLCAPFICALLALFGV